MTRNGYECSRPEHGDGAHDFPINAYVSARGCLTSLESAILNRPRNGLDRNGLDPS